MRNRLSCTKMPFHFRSYTKVGWLCRLFLQYIYMFRPHSQACLNGTYCDVLSCLSVDGIPYDGVPKDETVTVHIAVTVTLSVLATCGIIMTIVFLIFNFVFRERK